VTGKTSWRPTRWAAQRDTAIATVISVLGVALLYVGLFRGWSGRFLALTSCSWLC